MPEFGSVVLEAMEQASVVGDGQHQSLPMSSAIGSTGEEKRGGMQGLWPASLFLDYDIPNDSISWCFHWQPFPRPLASSEEVALP